MVFAWWMALLEVISKAAEVAGSAVTAGASGTASAVGKTAGAVAKHGVGTGGVLQAAGKSIGGKTGSLLEQGGKMVKAIEPFVGGGRGGGEEERLDRYPASQSKLGALRSDIGTGTRLNLEDYVRRLDATPLNRTRLIGASDIGRTGLGLGTTGVFGDRDREYARQLILQELMRRRLSDRLRGL